jgi:hypothetical protein
VKGLVEEAAHYLPGLLSDVSILQDIGAARTKAPGVNFDAILKFDFLNPLDGLLTALDPAQFLPRVLGPVTKGGAFEGTLTKTPSATVTVTGLEGHRGLITIEYLRFADGDLSIWGL